MSLQDHAEEAYLALLAELAQDALDREAAMRRLIEGQAGCDPAVSCRAVWADQVH